MHFNVRSARKWKSLTCAPTYSSRYDASFFLFFVCFIVFFISLFYLFHCFISLFYLFHCFIYFIVCLFISLFYLFHCFIYFIVCLFICFAHKEDKTGIKMVGPVAIDFHSVRGVTRGVKEAELELPGVGKAVVAVCNGIAAGD
jgi:hypothetical protein